jgi:hypothetical protein
MLRMPASTRRRPIAVPQPAEKKTIRQYAHLLGINQAQFDTIKQEAKRRYAEFKEKAT